jgi:DNA mismatch repair protein MutL
LASISSVSRLTLESKTADEAAGARLLIEGGKECSFEPAGLNRGTTVRVEDLFMTVPARLKFLKTDSTERAQIDNLVARYALAYPHVRFQLEQDGHTGLMTPGNGNRREVLAGLYGLDLARQMIEVLSGRGHGFGWIYQSHCLTRGTRKDITFFVTAVGLRPGIEQRVDSSVSYNVDGWTFSSGCAVPYFASRIYRCECAFGESRCPLPQSGSSIQYCSARRTARAAGFFACTVVQPPVGKLSTAATSGLSRLADGGRSGFTEKPQEETSPESQKELTAQPEFSSGFLPLLRLVGQIGATYLVAEAPDGLY